MNGVKASAAAWFTWFRPFIAFLPEWHRLKLPVTFQTAHLVERGDAYRLRTIC